MIWIKYASDIWRGPVDRPANSVALPEIAAQLLRQRYAERPHRVAGCFSMKHARFRRKQPPIPGSADYTRIRVRRPRHAVAVHINTVDCETQYEGVATCERISEAFLIPVLEALLDSFPFVIRGFHTDNGSEYINHHVTKLLNELLIEEQTKSRSRHSNDNALAESKNGAIIRKHLGYSHIPQHFATLVNTFCCDHLNPYINFHRPCLFAETITDAKGRSRKRYPYKLMMTPYEKLKSLPLAKAFLKKEITFEQLDLQAKAMSDNDVAQRLNDARVILFKTIFNRSKKTA